MEEIFEQGVIENEVMKSPESSTTVDILLNA